jgi:hypothetical protein
MITNAQSIAWTTRKMIRAPRLPEPRSTPSPPKSEHDAIAWQVAIEALLLAAGVSGAEIGQEAAAQAGARLMKHGP